MKLEQKMANVLTQTHIHTYHVTLYANCRKSKSSNNVVFLKTHFLKPFSKFPSRTTQIRLASPSSLTTTHTVSDSKHRTLLVEAYHVHRSLRILLEKLQKQDSNPLNILNEDGDWSNDHFWAVVNFLQNASRFAEILQVWTLDPYYFLCLVFLTNLDALHKLVLIALGFGWNL